MAHSCVLRNGNLPTHALVSIAECHSYDDEAVYEACRQLLMPFGGMHQFVHRGDVVLLKPNMLAIASPEEAATTHPAVLRALIRMVRECGGKPIIADSPAFGTLVQVAEATGIAALCHEMDVPLDTWHSTVHLLHPLNASWSLLTGREATEVDVIINVPKFKTHVQVGFSGAVKNMFGCVPGKRKAWLHMTVGSSEQKFAMMLLGYYLALKPKLTIVDAIVAMHGNGPRKGMPYPLKMLLASTDAVAVDVALTALVGIPQSHQLVPDAARHYELPTAFLENITMVGRPTSNLIEPSFDFPELIGTGFSPVRVIKSIIKNWHTILTQRIRGGS